ncbi:ParA family protein [Rhodocyclus tenuis]|uniref:ParA family protein n=1 Tax=Rhodocyclus gracilis TaxID=2929842 RepID=A0ABX0WKY5_9RHOO|nr:ParA family protein [Rhodocyclus gracilis]MRD74030.1 AAA family ATPase [Rhodocyclus gracilis]NJA89961.1 ParA family protein [Rhodocyclus gracilis]
MARILAISNRKGGAGKTTTAVNVAAEIAARGERVVLIDLDSQGHCALGFGIKVERDAPSAHGLFTGANTLRQALRPTRWPQLSLIPADSRFEHGGADTGLLQRALGAEGFLDEALTLILDTPPSLDALLLNALTAADRVLTPFVPHPLAGEGVRALARILFRVAADRSNAGLRVLGFLPVMLDTRIGQHRSVSDSIAQQFGASRMLPGIRSDIKLAEAFAAGQPIRDYAPHSRGADDYRAATDAILERWN